MGTRDAGSSDADAGRDAGNSDQVCGDRSTERDGVCVPECLPLPASFQRVDAPASEPPFGNTVWFDPDIITAEDPTSLAELTATGTGARTMFDRRTNAFSEVQAYLFHAQFGSTIELEIQVNPEFTTEEAAREARRHALVIGKLPAFLFAGLKTVWIHKGKELFGGGNENLLIHTDQTAAYEADGVLEEVFIHEATHSTLDPAHAGAADWRAAQEADGVAISPYARDNPAREDLSETLGPYLAARFRTERLGQGVAEKLERALPNRFKYLDCLELSMALPQ